MDKINRYSPCLNIFLVFFLSFSLSSLAWGRPPPKRLVPKQMTVTPNPSEEEEPSLDLRPKNVRPLKEEETWGPVSPLENISLSVLIATPLGGENFYEKRFQAIGDLFLLSIPLSRLSRNTFLHLETGPGFTVARLALTQPAVNFTHLYLVLPTHLRLIYQVSRSFNLEVYGGGMLRFVEHDSRNTNDGGTRFPKQNLVEPDGGIGLSYNISPALKIRLNAGYLFLSGGLELTL